MPRRRYRQRATPQPSPFLRMSVEQGERYKRLAKELKDAGQGDLRKQVNRNIRAAGKPVVRDVQSAARNVEVSSSKGGNARPDRSTGLRDRVAQATTLSVTAKGIQVKVSAKKFGEYGKTMPKYLDAYRRYSRWRHPVFGKETVWATQQGQPYFGATIKKHARDFRSAIQKAMDDVVEDIEE